MASEFTMTRRVTFAETDLAGVLHFSNYFRIMEDAEHAFWRSIGLCVMMPEGQATLSWPRVKVSCDYFGPVHFEDELELRMKITNIGEKSLSYETEFLHQARRVAVGRTIVVCCLSDGGAFQSIQIPERIRVLLS